MSVNLSEDANILRLYESAASIQDIEPRNYLGMSSMGESCDRRLWLDFRQARLNWFEAKTLFNFADGHYSEDITAIRLNNVPGIELKVDDGTGAQFGFSDFGGHFAGHMDGKITGLSQAKDKLHVWEHKCCSHSVYNKFIKLRQGMEEKKVLEQWSPKYYAQAQLYMEYADIERHYLTVASAGSRSYSAVRTERKKSVGERLKQRAHDIIASDKPLDKISNDVDYWECKFCNHAPLCHGNELPRAVCRTCIYSYPITEGNDAKWYCQKFNASFGKYDHLNDCTAHLYIPALLSNVAELIGADRENESIRYVNKITGNEFINGPHLDQYTSKEIEGCQSPIFLGDVIVNDIKKTFDAKIRG